MSISPEGEPGPEPTPYVGAYRIARKTWLYMITDDDGSRDITNREAYVKAEMTSKYPDMPEQDRQWLDDRAYDAVVDDFHRS